MATKRTERDGEEIDISKIKTQRIEGDTICENNEKSHVGYDTNIQEIRIYINYYIRTYIKLLANEDYTIDTLFHDDDEGLLKYIRLILKTKEALTTKEDEDLNVILKSLLDAIQVDQAHDFLDGSGRTTNSLNKNLSSCLASNVSSVHTKINEYLEKFNSDNSSNDVKSLSSVNYDMPDVNFSIIDTGAKEDKSKEIVSKTQQVVALASIIDSAGCSQKNRNMPKELTDDLELIIINIGYIFYQAFYRWFRIKNIATIIAINDNSSIQELISSCKKTYSINFYKDGAIIYTQKDVIPGCNGDFTVNKIVTTLHKTPTECCNLLFKGINDTLIDPVETKRIIMTYYVLNKGFGDFSQMFSCLYFNNRRSYDLTQKEIKTQNIHYKNIILCTIDRFLAYICHLCKCPFVLGASTTCRYYSCDTNAKYYNLSVIDAYNKFNDLKLTDVVKGQSINRVLVLNKSGKKDYKSKLIDRKNYISQKYYNEHIIKVTEKDHCIILSLHEKINLSSLICSLPLLSITTTELNEKFIKDDDVKFNTLKDIYIKLQNNSLNTIAETVFFHDFILEIYGDVFEKTIFTPNAVRNIVRYFKTTSSITGNTKGQDIGAYCNNILAKYIDHIRTNISTLEFLTSYLENIKDNMRLLENYFKKLYIIIENIIENNIENNALLEYIFENIKKLKKCLDLLIIKEHNVTLELELKHKIGITRTIYINLNYYTDDNFDLLETAINASNFSGITLIYNQFILQFNTFKFIERRVESLNFEEAINRANTAYYIAYGMVRLKISKDDSDIVIIKKTDFKNVAKKLYYLNNVVQAMKQYIPEKSDSDYSMYDGNNEIIGDDNTIIGGEQSIKKLRSGYNWDAVVTRTSHTAVAEHAFPFLTEKDLLTIIKESLSPNIIIPFFKDESSIIQINLNFKTIDGIQTIDGIKKIDDIQTINSIFQEYIKSRDNIEASQEKEDFETNIERLEEDKYDYGDYDYFYDDTKDGCTPVYAYVSGGNIKENKLLNRYNERIILIKYNIKELIKNNKDNNVEKMQKKIKDIKMKIKNIKEKEKKNKSKQPKHVKEIKVKQLKPVKDTKDKKQKPVKEIKVKQPKPVKDTKDKKQKPVKEIKVKQPKPVKETKDKKPKPVKEIKVKQPKHVKETKDKKPKHVKETNVKQPKNLKETKVKQPKNLKDSKSKSPKPEKDSKSKSHKPEKEIKSKSPKPEKESKSKSPKSEKDSKSKSLKPEKEIKSKSLKPEKEIKSKSPKPEKDSKSKSPKL